MNMFERARENVQVCQKERERKRESVDERDGDLWVPVCLN